MLNWSKYGDTAAALRFAVINGLEHRRRISDKTAIYSAAAIDQQVNIIDSQIGEVINAAAAGILSDARRALEDEGRAAANGLQPANTTYWTAQCRIDASNLSTQQLLDLYQTTAQTKPAARSVALEGVLEPLLSSTIPEVWAQTKEDCRLLRSSKAAKQTAAILVLEERLPVFQAETVTFYQQAIDTDVLDDMQILTSWQTIRDAAVLAQEGA